MCCCKFYIEIQLFIVQSIFFLYLDDPNYVVPTSPPGRKKHVCVTQLPL